MHDAGTWNGDKKAGRVTQSRQVISDVDTERDRGRDGHGQCSGQCASGTAGGDAAESSQGKK